MQIELIDGEFSVCKLKDFKTTYFDKEFCFACKSDKEFSLTCRTVDAPKNCLEKEDGFVAMRIGGSLCFSLVGILSAITSLLADLSIPVFAVSTYDTDYFLIKTQDVDKALHALKTAGYEIKI